MMPDKLPHITHSPTRSPFARLLRKLLVGFVALGLLLLVAFSYNSWEEENLDMQRSLAIQAGFAAKSSQAVFDNIGDGMEILGRLLLEIDAVHHLELARPALQEFQSDHPEILGMSLVGPNGVTLLSSPAEKGEALPDFRRDADYLRAFLFDLNNTYAYNIGRNQFGMGSNRRYFPIRHSVEDSSGNPSFVIQAAIAEDCAKTLWSDLPLFPGSRVGLLRNDGYVQLLWPSAESGQIFSQPLTGALRQTLQAHPGRVSGSYVGASSIDGMLRLGAYTRLPDANMVAFVSVPKIYVLNRWWNHNYPILLSFLAYLGVIVAIAIRLAARETLHTQELLAESRKDPLTGLPNRIAIDEIITREIARGRRHAEHSALLYLDLDKFKDINDKLGHSSGDRLLELVAQRLGTISREEDVPARLGGDEFLVMLPCSSAEKASNVAQRIIDALAMPFHLAGQDIVVSTSIGICIFPDNGADFSTLLQNADAAMYEAKRQGRSCFVFYREELGERIRERLQLQHDFLRALHDQEFLLHYQPLVDLANGKIVGAEALVRWMDPQKGLRNPGEFIPFAEESGVILQLGEWVLKSACRQAKLWADQGYDIHIAVNLSTRQFQDPELFTKISGALSDAGLAPGKLELEITESASMLDPEASIQMMEKLQSIGIQIAIDDFGTGYSSLSYLKRIPADIIKIDRSFVNGIHNDQDKAIVLAILGLGNSLGKRCLAEGIETAEQFESLGSLGCHFGQGYWMQKPLAADQFQHLLKEGKCYKTQSSHQALAII